MELLILDESELIVFMRDLMNEYALGQDGFVLFKLTSNCKLAIRPQACAPTR